MLERPKFPKSKNVLLIVDFPTKGEVAEEDPFASPSNMNLLTSLKIGKLYSSSKTPEIDGIPYGDVYSTYFDYRGKLEYEYKDSFAKRKDLEETSYGFVKKEDNNVEENYVAENGWFRLEHQKDCFVRQDLWIEFQGLLKEIETVKPKLIIVTGKWAFFFLSGTVSLTGTQGNAKDKKPLGGLNKFRASIIESWEGFNLPTNVLIPIYHTLNAVTMQDKSFIILADLQKVIWTYYTILKEGLAFFKDVKHEYLVGVDKEQILDYFEELLNLPSDIVVSIDIETVYHSVIDCIGFSYENNRGLCVPFCTVDNSSLWSYEDELEITLKMLEVLASPQVQFNTVGQNFSYDAQYLYKLYGIKLNANNDTMVLNHVLFNYLPKDLAFLASIYCPRYKYWKDEITADKETPEVRWKYNVKDICWTREILEAQLTILETRPEKQKEFYHFQQREISPCLQEMMYIGVKVDTKKKHNLHKQLEEILKQIEGTINDMFGYSLPNIEVNLKSPKQIGALFTDLLKIEPIIDKKTKTVTFGSDAMLMYREQYPQYYPLITLILEYRSIGVFVRTFLGAELDDDDRIRTAYGVAGTKSYRLSSRKNAFGKGLNMANIPSKGKIALNYSLDLDSVDSEEVAEDVQLVEEESLTKLPNCKEIFLPDEGTVFWNADYSGADAMVVAAESRCDFLLDFFNNSNEKLYIYLAREFLQRDITTSDDFYKKMKQWCHLCLTGEHEVLTKNGWIRLDKYNQVDAIATFDKDTCDITFEQPNHFTESYVTDEEDLLEIKGGHFNQIVTKKHRLCGKITDKQRYKVYEAQNIPVNTKLPLNGFYVGGTTSFSDDYVRLIVALQADGYIHYIDKARTVTVAFGFTKERKITRLEYLLKACNLEYRISKYTPKEGKEVTKFFVKEGFDEYMKYAGSWLLKLTKSNLQTFVSELPYWDGCVRSTQTRTSISSSNLTNIIWYQTLIHLCGKTSVISKGIRAEEHHNTNFNVSINKYKHFRVKEDSVKVVKHSGTKVYCPTVSTGFFMIRHKEHIMVTGNSNYGGMPAKAAASSGLDIKTATSLRDWYFHKDRCGAILDWHKRITSEVNGRGYIENIFGARFYLLDKNCPTLLNQAYALIPQSTIAILINKGIVNIFRNETDLVFGKAANTNRTRNSIIPLMQIHDAASGIFIDRSDKENDQTLGRIIKHLEIALPYKKPLIIPADGSWSRNSYGECK